MPTQDILLAPVPKKMSRRAGGFNPKGRRYVLLSDASGDTLALKPAAKQILKSGREWEMTADPCVPKDQLAVTIRVEPNPERHEQGYSLVYGARPLKRSLQKLILDPLAMEILAGKFAEGDNILIDLSKKDEITLTKK